MKIDVILYKSPPMYRYGIRCSLLVLIVPFLMGFCLKHQGIRGQVLLQKEPYMPLKGNSKQLGSPYITDIYLYKTANTDQLIGQKGNFAKSMQSKLIKKVRTSKEGRFNIRLSPGTYTLLLGYGDGLFIPFFSGMNGVAHIEVKKHHFQEIDLTINASSIF